MNINQLNCNDLEKMKKKIIEKEDEILKSQIKQNKLESKRKKLELKKEKIIKKRKSKLTRIMSYLIYDITMITILIFITKFINELVITKSIKMLSIFIGITVACISGSFISNKIDELVKEYFGRKKLSKITTIIKENEVKIKLEIDKQELLKKEITNIINRSENTTTHQYNIEKTKYNYKKLEPKMEESKEKIKLDSKIRIRRH